MNVTLKDKPVACDKRKLDQSKTNLKPTFFQLKTYEHDGILQELAYMLIRPPRFIYNPDILTPSKKNSKRFSVQTHTIPFQLTIYLPQQVKYIILYLHGNGSSRFEGYLFLPSLPDGVGLACFDFAGCGNRFDSQFITLGQQQSKDVNIAAKFLKNQGHRVVGWGRSMGAVALLMSCQLNIMIADSAYSNLSTLCKQSSSKFLPKACCCVFHTFFPCVFACIRCKVRSLSNLQIQDMDVLARLRRQSVTDPYKQICFIHGQEDTLIPSTHAQLLYNAHMGRKMLVSFAGTHNSTRPQEVLNRCFQFIEEGIYSNFQRVRLPENVMMNKMVQMQTFNNNSILGQKRLTQKTDQIVVSPSKNSIDACSGMGDGRPSQLESMERGQQYVRFHTEYTNGRTIHKTQEGKHEESFCQAGDDFLKNIDKKQPIASNFCEVMGSEDLQEYPRSQNYEQTKQKHNQNRERGESQKRESSGLRSKQGVGRRQMVDSKKEAMMSKLFQKKL